jgi:hypothetical protein
MVGEGARNRNGRGRWGGRHLGSKEGGRERDWERGKEGNQLLELAAHVNEGHVALALHIQRLEEADHWAFRAWRGYIYIYIYGYIDINIYYPIHNIRQTESETETRRKKHREEDWGRHRNREPQRQRDTETETERERQTDREKERDEEKNKEREMHLCMLHMLWVGPFSML